MEESQTMLWIVAIVAVVGLVGMVVAASSGSLPSQTLSGDAKSFCYENTVYTSNGGSAEPSANTVTCCYAISGGGNIAWHVWYDSGANYGVSGKAPSDCAINGMR